MMKGRVVLVTGASRGIGAATAKLLAASGAAVAVNFFNSEGAAREVVDAIGAGGGRAIAVRADARAPAQVQAMVAHVERKLGQIDTLVVNTAKSGLDGLMRSLALELGPSGIRVNVVAPGLTDTDATAGQPAQVKQMTARATPLGRIGLPDDVAGAVLLVASDHARFVTGAYVPVTGGNMMS